MLDSGCSKLTKNEIEIQPSRHFVLKGFALIFACDVIHDALVGVLQRAAELRC